jgi:hypothetical protein
MDKHWYSKMRHWFLVHIYPLWWKALDLKVFGFVVHHKHGSWFWGFAFGNSLCDVIRCFRCTFLVAIAYGICLVNIMLIPTGNSLQLED